MTCMALIRTDVRQRSAASFIGKKPVGFGYGPSQLQSAYKLPSATAGAGQKVAVVDAYNYPGAVADFNFYRSAWGLPACNSSTGAGCLTVVNQNGKASPLPSNSGSSGWATEAALDMDMAAAICPKCHVILVEANSPSIQNLGTAVNSAVKLGAKFVSNSYGGSQSSSDGTYDSLYYKHAGVAVTVSAGDSGYGVSYPAASQYVTSVGGTALTTASGSRGWKETVWTGTGSGCSTASEGKPSWQHDTGCTHRTDNDVAAVADPNTGVAIYDTYDQGGWLQVGGTSVSSPIIAAVFALAGTPVAGTYPSSYPYAHTSKLFDVTSGSNGSCSPAYLCTGEVGYDGPTGWGTPNGTAAFHK
jgi:subtilase family serine protease